MRRMESRLDVIAGRLSLKVADQLEPPTKGMPGLVTVVRWLETPMCEKLGTTQRVGSCLLAEVEPGPGTAGA